MSEYGKMFDYRYHEDELPILTHAVYIGPMTKPVQQQEFSFVDECTLKAYDEPIGDGKFWHVTPIGNTMEHVFTSDYMGYFIRNREK